MALAKLFQKMQPLMLRPFIKCVAPSTTVKSSAPLQKFWITAKPEYDEKGELGYPDDEDLATGIWKKELEARAAGDDDPYTIGAISRGDKGTKLDPIRVPSSFESRVIGCKCNPEQLSILHMWLHQGEPRRCRCGFWMVLYYKEPFHDWSIPQ